jgi:hypothetical protein
LDTTVDSMAATTEASAATAAANPCSFVTSPDESSNGGLQSPA